jgi:hypothetical protein
MDGTKSAYEKCFKKSKTVFDACMMMKDEPATWMIPMNFTEACSRFKSLYEMQCVKMNTAARENAVVSKKNGT